LIEIRLFPLLGIILKEVEMRLESGSKEKVNQRG
jgi:hypothetical protein